MGKKSSDVPAPDPRLVEAQVRSMGIQDDAIGEILALARRQTENAEELLPMQREAMQFSLDAARTGYAQSQEDRSWLLDRRGSLSGVQDALVREAREFNAPGREAQMVAQATADAGKALSDRRQARERELASMGVTPGSGRSAAADSVDEARLVAGAANAGRTQARAEGRMLTDRAVNALAGYPAMASGATGQGAAIGGSVVDLSGRGISGVNSIYAPMVGAQQAAAGVAGQMGSNATGMYGAQANYKLAADKQAGDASWLGDLGALAGGAAQAWKVFSAREYKQDIVRIGDHPRLPIGLYQWRYKPEFREKMGDAHFIGVMADEVATVRPEAVSTDADGHTVVDYSLI